MPQGTPVYSTASGVPSYVATDDNWTPTIYIRRKDSRLYYYTHLDPKSFSSALLAAIRDQKEIPVGTFLGSVIKPIPNQPAHVHFGMVDCAKHRHLNPMLNMSYEDHISPVVAAILFQPWGDDYRLDPATLEQNIISGPVHLTAIAFDQIDRQPGLYPPQKLSFKIYSPDNRIIFDRMLFDGSSVSPKVNNARGLISFGYGIVTAHDLAQDAKERVLDAYDSNKNQAGRYWQCVPTKTVKRDYNFSLGEDGAGPAGKEIPMCDLEIIVDLPTGRHVYSDRRRHPKAFCQQFEQNWRRLTQGEAVVCFNGDDPSNENDAVFGRYRSWVWNKFKTARGCYSYFGNCSS